MSLSSSSLPPAGLQRKGGPYFGVDIGGTKCAVSVLREDRVEEIGRFPTREFEATFADLAAALAAVIRHPAPQFGISCGGPLDVSAGRIISTPNLPRSWHGVPIVERLTARFGGRAALMNDANACALAEWNFGAGRGTRHMVFLTSGTGMGSGLILNGRLYEGATGDAGEIGHVRLRPDGPVGFNKAGSVEGFTSGGGIARLAESLLAGVPQRPGWAATGTPLTLKQIADAAGEGDALALDVLRVAGERLGETLAILIDLFNPERVVIGGFFPRCRHLLEPHLRAALEREALAVPRAACQIVPAALGETIGSHGAIAAALHAFEPASGGG
jgi:glucokinase